MLENYDIVEMNGKKFPVTYKKEKRIIWAIAYVNGREVKKHGDSYQTAHWALTQAIHQILNFRL